MSRGKGKSAVAAAAYRSGEKLTNEWDGVTHDYTRKGGVVHTEIMLPPHAPPSFSDRSTLWNSVELYEKAGNAQLAREIDAALPIELSREEQIRLVREYCSSQFVSRGMCVDYAIHDTDSGNPHCHIMLTMRPLDERGTWAAKSKKEYDLDENGERIRLPSGRYKTHKVDLTGWNDKDNTLLWRKAWADYTNDFLERNGSPERIDHRSNAERGIDEIPTVHMGVAACQMEKKGLTFRLEANPNATSYQDQGYLQAGEWNGDSYIPREVIYVGPTDRCRELLYQLEAGDMTARQVRALDQTDSKELEALYLLDDAAYLHIQLRDEGYDYTLYDKETMRLRDGGVIDAEDVALSPIKHPLAAVREEVFDTMGERPEKVEAVPLELVEKLQEAQLEPPAVSSREKLIEHFAAEDAVLFDTELDTYPMPDPSMSMEHLTEAGYTENDLLPLSLDTAELMYGSDFTVYLIRPGENPEMVFDETDFDNHDGLFAVPREEWEASPDFDDAIQNRLREEEQQRREAAFLDHQGDCFALYQLHRGPELRDLRDISLERLRAEGASPRKGNYDLVYTAPLTGQGDTLQ